MPPKFVAEIPGCIVVPADRSNYRLRPPSILSYDLIVIHITSGHPAAEPVAEMWQEPFHGTSAHFVIGQDGTAIQTVPLRFAAQHAHAVANARSVGIEHCAREPNEPSFPPGDPGLPPSQELLQKSAQIVAYLLKAAGLAPTRGYVKGHAEVDPLTTHRQCPDGAPWPWGAYMTLVQAAYAAIGEPPNVA